MMSLYAFRLSYVAFSYEGDRRLVALLISTNLVYLTSSHFQLIDFTRVQVVAIRFAAKNALAATYLYLYMAT